MVAALIVAIIFCTLCVLRARSVGSDYDDGFEDARDFFERK